MEWTTKELKATKKSLDHLHGIHKKNPRNAGRKITTASGLAKQARSIKVDPELWQRAKAAGINLSQACEKGLRDMLQAKEATLNLSSEKSHVS